MPSYVLRTGIGDNHFAAIHFDAPSAEAAFADDVFIHCRPTSQLEDADGNVIAVAELHWQGPEFGWMIVRRMVGEWSREADTRDDLTICRVHDADDVVPGRICGRYLPCREHPEAGR